jgi:hypothetical protein
MNMLDVDSSISAMLKGEPMDKSLATLLVTYLSIEDDSWSYQMTDTQDGQCIVECTDSYGLPVKEVI